MFARRHSFALLLLLVLPIAAQQGATIFHHFRHYPSGQYTTVMHGTITGAPPTAPITETTCTVPPTPAQLAQSLQMASQVAAMQNCVNRVIRDEENVAESEQTCTTGPRVQTIRTTMTAIDDRNFTTDTVSKVGRIEMANHSNVHYDGPCTAAQIAETTRAAQAKPSPEECADFLANSKDMSKGCDDAPVDSRATCKKQIEAASAMIAPILAACAK